MTIDLLSRVRAVNPMRSIARPLVTALTVAGAAFVTACSSDGPTAVFDANAPARLALDASVRFQTGSNAVLRVNTSYQRNNQSLVPLDSQSIALTDAASQQVPITIDLAPCLRDPLHATSPSQTGAADDCLVTLELALVTNGAVVDRDTVRSVSMRPGATAAVSNAIVLEEVGIVTLTPPPANVVAAGQPLRLEATRTMTVTAAVIDGASRPITRTVTWSTANAAVATVSASGVVTGVAPGTTRITAAAGTRSAFVDVRVVPLPQPVTVTAGTGSSGTGTVVSTPAGINCTITGTTTTGTCTANFPGDASVSLAMTTGTNTTFSGWGGDCTGATACSFVTSQPRTVSANLRSFRTLTVTASGSGNGTITAPGAVINCVWRFGSVSSGPCTAQIPDGAQVTLTATAESGSQFFAWTGNCDTVAGNSCTTTMSANRTINAEFRALSVHRITAGFGTGSGVVTSSPAGMNCVVNGTAISGTCSLTVTAGTPVSLTATGTSGATFRSWDGACTFGGNPCVFSGLVTPGTFESRVAFDRLANLTITPDPLSTGTGQLNGTELFFCRMTGTTVTSAPCTATFVVGTAVTIDASTIGYTDWTQWGGVCASATSSRCTFTINNDVTGTVRFTEVPTATIETRLEGYDHSISVRHPYQSAQGCSRTASEGYSTPTTICSLTVPVQRDFTMSIQVPGPGWSYYYSDGLCIDHYPSSIPCVRRVSRDTFTLTYAYPDSLGTPPPPAGSKNTGSMRGAPAGLFSPIKKSKGTQ